MLPHRQRGIWSSKFKPFVFWNVFKDYWNQRLPHPNRNSAAAGRHRGSAVGANTQQKEIYEFKIIGLDPLCILLFSIFKRHRFRPTVWTHASHMICYDVDLSGRLHRCLQAFIFTLCYHLGRTDIWLIVLDPFCGLITRPLNIESFSILIKHLLFGDHFFLEIMATKWMLSACNVHFWFYVISFHIGLYKHFHLSLKNVYISVYLQ